MSASSAKTPESPSSLLLAPAASQDRRQWHIGYAPPAICDAVVLPFCASTRSFASLREVWLALGPTFRNHRAYDFQRLDGYLQACDEVDSFASAGPSLALSRRISRESGPATRAVELSAHLLLDGAAAAFRDRAIVFPDVDQLDILTLRVVARAAVLLADHHKITLIFHSRSDPRDVRATGLAELSRADILLNAAQCGHFTFTPGDSSSLPTRAHGVQSLVQAALDLAAHNYEATLLTCGDSRTASGHTAEALRLSALAAINLGALDASNQLLLQAIDSTYGPGLRAHCYCLLALIATKRRNDLATSDAMIGNGLKELETRTAHPSDDAVERAWLFNARALNLALAYRQTGDLSAFRAAHDLEVQASKIVASGSSSERTYLRMNLLANLAFLWEMAKAPQYSIEILEKVFRRKLDLGVAETATLNYRLAVLYAKMGNYQHAAQVLDDVGYDSLPEEWYVIDHLLRARTHVARKVGELDKALDFAKRGYNIGLAARSREAVATHAQSMLYVLARKGRQAEADELYAQLTALGLTHESIERPIPLRSKLPAYIPEIDLEDVPCHDTNARLSADMPTRR